MFPVLKTSQKECVQFIKYLDFISKTSSDVRTLLDLVVQDEPTLSGRGKNPKVNYATVKSWIMWFKGCQQIEDLQEHPPPSQKEFFAVYEMYRLLHGPQRLLEFFKTQFTSEAFLKLRPYWEDASRTGSTQKPVDSNTVSNMAAGVFVRLKPEERHLLTTRAPVKIAFESIENADQFQATMIHDLSLTSPGMFCTMGLVSKRWYRYRASYRELFHKHVRISRWTAILPIGMFSAEPEECALQPVFLDQDGCQYYAELPIEEFNLPCYVTWSRVMGVSATYERGELFQMIHSEPPAGNIIQSQIMGQHPKLVGADHPFYGREIPQCSEVAEMFYPGIPVLEEPAVIPGNLLSFSKYYSALHHNPNDYNKVIYDTAKAATLLPLEDVTSPTPMRLTIKMRKILIEQLKSFKDTGFALVDPKYRLDMIDHHYSLQEILAKVDTKNTRLIIANVETADHASFVHNLTRALQATKVIWLQLATRGIGANYVRTMDTGLDELSIWSGHEL